MKKPAPGFKNHPGHTMTITDAEGPVSIKVNGEEIARSDKAKVLAEASYPFVYYIPREDMPESLLAKSSHQTHCPFKGTASYWDLTTENGLLENAVWSYCSPYDEALAIKGHLAFYPEAATVTLV